MRKEERIHQHSMKNQKFIRCKCGEEILLIPSVKEVDLAITGHAEVHAKKEKNSQKAKETFEGIENFLVEQVLIIASQNDDERS
jgi:hypothetical protein